MPKYGEKSYWDERYEEQAGTTFDWLEDYDSIKPILEELGIKKESRILNVGCGNSEFSEKMYEDGYTHNYSIDICENVIKFMKERNKEKKGLHFEVMDVTNMKYKDETFDLIVDKSTIDSLLCSTHAFMNVAKMTKEISRVLKEGGIYLIISYGKPESRMMHLERDHLAFDIQIYTIKREEDNSEEDQIHYCFICKKLPEAKSNLNNFDLVYKELEQEELEADEEEEEDDNRNEEDDNENKEEFLPPEDD